MSQPLAAYFNQALQLFQAGDLAGAETLIVEVLQREPQVFDLLHLLGVIRLRQGRCAEAVAAYDNALVLRPEAAEVWSNRGNALIALGRFEEAVRSYERALAIKPDSAETWSNCGVAFKELQAHDRALAAYDRALHLNPRHAKAWVNKGLTLNDLGRHTEALAAYDAALGIDANIAEAWSNKGITLDKLKDHEEALAAFERALRINPQLAEIWSNQGNALNELKRYEDALRAYEQALQIDPRHAAAWSNRGVALKNLERYDEALEAFAQALRLDPRNADTWSNQGNALAALQRYEEALGAYETALRLAPAAAETWSNKGVAFLGLRRHEEALAAQDTALQLKPSYADAWMNKGVVLNDLKRHEAALAAYDTALGMNPADAEVLSNKGAALNDMGRYAEALSIYAEALSLKPEGGEIHWNEALTRLVTGDFATGWKKYEYRWRNKQHEAYRHAAVPRLPSLQQAAGRRVLVWAEQGFGDTLHFSRYVPLLRQQHADVIFEVQPPLKGLLQCLRETAVLARGEALPAVDYQVPLMSLPGLFDTRLETIPAAIPYLQAKPERVAHWRARLASNRTRPHIGIACAGNPWHKNDVNRSIGLAQLAFLSENANLYLIQKELREGDAQLLAQTPAIVYVGEELRDFDDTAALVENMDLIVSVDTSLAHLAGALGKPLYLLLPWAAEWRWLLKRSDTPWYPSATLLRQLAPHDWSGVLDALAAKIAAADWRR